MMRFIFHNVVHLMILGVGTMLQIGMTLFLTKQVLLRDWFEKAIS
jgi:hypothetical protein